MYGAFNRLVRRLFNFPFYSFCRVVWAVCTSWIVTSREHCCWSFTLVMELGLWFQGVLVIPAVFYIPDWYCCNDKFSEEWHSHFNFACYGHSNWPWCTSFTDCSTVDFLFSKIYHRFWNRSIHKNFKVWFFMIGPVTCMKEPDRQEPMMWPA